MQGQTTLTFRSTFHGNTCKVEVPLNVLLSPEKCREVDNAFSCGGTCCCGGYALMGHDIFLDVVRRPGVTLDHPNALAYLVTRAQ